MAEYSQPTSVEHCLYFAGNVSGPRKTTAFMAGNKIDVCTNYLVGSSCLITFSDIPEKLNLYIIIFQNM